jgi:phosphoglycerate dehydrogenase-like enzyme
MPEGLVLADAALPFDAALWDRLRAAAAPDRVAVVTLGDERALRAALEQAEIAVLAGDLDERFLSAPRLRWIHCDHAGLTKSARPEVFASGLVVTGSAGRSAAALAEHVMMFALLLGSRYPDFYEAQKRHEWLRTPQMRDLRALSGRTMGIIGMGHTGQALAARARAFDMRVLGYRRREAPPPPGVERVYSADRGEAIDPILREADVLALVLNLSDRTRHLLDARAIGLMKPGAIVINLSRGGVIDHDALMAALREGRLSGAGLDVTDPEPLPPDHPLWDTPNVLITPHFTASLPDRSARSLEMIADNFRRFRAGEPMLNRILPEDVWTGGA